MITIDTVVVRSSQHNVGDNSVAQHSSGLFMTLRQMIKLVRKRLAGQMHGKGTLRGTAALGAKMSSSQPPDVQ